MSNHSARKLFAFPGALMITMILGKNTLCHAQEQENHPIVTSMKLVTYPRLLRESGIHGTVKGLVTTDGERVVDIKIYSGPPLLVRAVKESLESWVFEKHKATRFELTYEFAIAKEMTDVVDNGQITLSLPTTVKILVKRLRTHTHDPVERSVKIN